MELCAAGEISRHVSPAESGRVGLLSSVKNLHHLRTGLPLVKREVAIVDLQGQDAHCRRAQSATLPTDEPCVWIPTPIVHSNLLLKRDEPVSHTAGTSAIRLLRTRVPS